MRPAIAVPLLVAAVLAAPSRAQERIVITDRSWKGSEAAAPGWEAPDFDDSGWAQAADDSPLNRYLEYGIENVLGHRSSARWIWAGAGNRCLLRKAFEVPRFERIEMVVVADNAAVVHVNGEKVVAIDTDGVRWGRRGCAVLVDLDPHVELGTNVIAVEASNWGGPAGFAAEIRIDGEPFAPTAPGAEIPAEAEALAGELVRALDDPDYETREQATRDLRAAFRRYGPRLRASLPPGASPEVRVRFDLATQDATPSLDPPPGRDARFGFGRLTAGELEGALSSTNEGRAPEVATLFAAAHLASVDPTAYATAISRGLAHRGAPVRERSVRIVAALDDRDRVGLLLEVLAGDPDSTAGALAASALGRLGDASVRPALEAAAGLDAGTTRRAVRRALDRLER